MSIIQMLRHSNSTNVKQDILASYATNIWRQVFYYTYHPDMTYGITNISAEMHELGEPSKEMFKLLDDLRMRVLTGTAARDAVKDFMDEHGSLIALICKKDLACGVTATTLNKVFGKGFIPIFKVQLAEEVEVRKVKLPIVGQLKYDGVRIVAIVANNDVIFKTRNGKVIEFPALREEILRSAYSNYILDGELTMSTGAMDTRTSVSGLVNSAIHGTPIKVTNLAFNVFDAMTLEEFNSNECPHSYAYRFAQAKTLVSTIRRMTPELLRSIVQLAETYEFISHEQIEDSFAKLVSEGFEGLILKQWDHKYTFKRSKDWIKVKSIKDTALLCSGIEPGKLGTKYENGIGSLLCHGLVEGKQVIVSVGSGLSDADRNSSYSHFVGKKIDVKYNGVIENKADGSFSLFLPRFVCIREDL